MYPSRLLIAGCILLFGVRAAPAAPLPLFTHLAPANHDQVPLPEDALALWDSTVDVIGIAGMPGEIDVTIPRSEGDVAATIQLERMVRREGFGERDGYACSHGDPRGCEIIPWPDFPAERFSYTWIGQGDGYDLRLTVHHGHAVGVLSGAQGRFAIAWDSLKELRQSWFRTDDSFVHDAQADAARVPVKATSAPPSSPLSSAMARAATLATIQSPRDRTATTTTLTPLDMLVLFTEEARIQAGGDPGDCRDTDGVMTYIHQNITSMDTAFERSLIPGRIGTVTVTRLTGFTLIPYNYDSANPHLNLNNIQQSSNIRAYRDAVGADVVATLVDTQANLGPCGVSYIQRPNCSGISPGCGMGPLFADWTYLLETVQCSVMDTFTHELGHLLGAEHDAAHTSATAATASFPYSFGYGYGYPGTGFETLMSQRFSPNLYPRRLLQFSNPNVTDAYSGQPTGIAASAYNALTLANLLPGTAAFRNRPEVIFADGFDDATTCPGIAY